MTRTTKKLFLLPALVAALLTFAATPAVAAKGLGVTSTFGKEVNKTKVEEKEKGDAVTEAEENVCTAASEDVCQAGKSGSEPGELSLAASPEGSGAGSGLAVDRAGAVYVADTGNNRVEWFNSAGKYEGEFDGTEIDGAPAGKGKEAPTRLSAPEAIAIDNNPGSPSFQDVYVTTEEGGKLVVDKFSATGDFILQLATTEVIYGSGIATDPSGSVWVYLQSGVVQEFSNAADNQLLTALSIPTVFPTGISVDADGNLYIRFGTTQVEKFSNTGTELGRVCENECANGVASDPVTNDLFVDTKSSIAEYGPFGEPFGAPVVAAKLAILGDGAGIAVSPTEAEPEVYVADVARDAIVQLRFGSAPERPEALAATEPKGKSAILHGNLSPRSSPTRLRYYFEYNTGSSCAGGAKTPLKEGEGSVSDAVTGLEPSTEYTFCLVSENIYAASEPGSSASFTTLPAPPEVIGESAATAEGEPEELVLSAAINPDDSKQETTYYFEYSERANGETLEAPIATAEGSGTIVAEAFGEHFVSSVPVEHVPVTATVYYRIVASNETGTERGKVEAYTKLPIVDSEGSSELTLTEATLEAKISPDFATAKYHFEYATSEAALKNDEGTQVPGGRKFGEMEELPVSAVVSALTPHTLYYYRVVLENQVSEYPGNVNEGKPIVGKPETFTTESLPFVSTGEARSITRTSATLSGAVTPIDQATTYYFQYVSEAGYQEALAGDPEEKADPYTASETTAPLGLAVSTAPQAVGPILAGGLLPGETYHYRLLAKNEFGAEYGEDHTFTTGAAVLPGVSTGGASGVSQNSATLSGTVSTNGLQTDYGFEIGTEPGNYGPATGLGSIGGTQTEEVSVRLSELASGVTYYYRITAANADGTVYGAPGVFTTPGFSTLIAPPSAPPLIATPNIAFPKPGEASRTTAKTLTNKERLAKALKTCKKDKSKRKRVACEKQAKKKSRQRRSQH